jgi:hypothetical protein
MGIIRKRFRIVNCKLHSVDRRHQTHPHDMHWFKASQPVSEIRGTRSCRAECANAVSPLAYDILKRGCL